MTDEEVIDQVCMWLDRSDICDIFGCDEKQTRLKRLAYWEAHTPSPEAQEVLQRL